MKNRSLLVAVVALAALMFVPSVASADHRFGTDRGSRYSGYHGGGGSHSYWNVSLGFGNGGYYHGGGGYSHVGVSFGRSPTYYRGGYARYYPRYYAAPAYCAPAPVYYAPRVVYAAPAYCAPAPVYYAPRPVYTSSYYYSSGGYYCGR